MELEDMTTTTKPPASSSDQTGDPVAEKTAEKEMTGSPVYDPEATGWSGG